APTSTLPTIGEIAPLCHVRAGAEDRISKKVAFLWVARFCEQPRFSSHPRFPIDFYIHARKVCGPGLRSNVGAVRRSRRSAPQHDQLLLEQEILRDHRAYSTGATEPRSDDGQV